MKNMRPQHLQAGSSIVGRQVSSSKRSPRRSETSKAKKDLEMELLNNLKDQVSVLQREREELIEGKVATVVPPAPPPPPSGNMNLGFVPKPASRHDLPDFDSHVKSVRAADTIDKLERDLKSQSDYRVRSDGERLKLQSRLDDTQRSLLSLQRDTSELAKQHSSLKSRHQTELLSLEKHNTSHEAEITRLTNLLEQSETKFNDKEFERLRTANRNYEDEVKRLSRLLESEQKKYQSEYQHRPGQSLEEEVKRQAVELSNKSDEIRRLNNLIDNGNHHHSNNDEVSRLNRLLGDKNDEISRLKRQMNSTATSPTNLISASEADRLYDQLREKNADIRRLNKQIDDHQHHYPENDSLRLNSLLDQRNADIRKLQQEVDDLRTNRFTSRNGRNFDIHDNPSPLPMQSPFMEQSEEFYKGENIRKDEIIISLRKQLEDCNGENQRLRGVSQQLQTHHHETLRRQHAVQKETERLVSSVAILNSSSAEVEANHNYQVSRLLGDALVAASPISPRRAMRMKSAKTLHENTSPGLIDIPQPSPSVRRPVIKGLIY